MSLTPSQIATVTTVLGPLSLSIYFGLILEGIILCQVFTYYDSKHRDPWHIKLLVALATVLTLFLTVIMGWQLYMYFTKYFGAVNRALLVDWAYKSRLFVTPLVFACCSIYYILAIVRVLERPGAKIAFASVLGALVLSSLGLLFAQFANALSISSILVFAVDGYTRRLFISATVINIILTAFIAAAMVWVLRRERGEAKAVDTPINRVMTFVAASNAFTCVIFFISLILLVSMPRKEWFSLLFNVLPFIFQASMMMALNSREQLRSIMFSSTMTGGSAVGSNTYGRPTHSALSNEKAGGDPHDMSIRLTQDVETETSAPPKTF